MKVNENLLSGVFVQRQTTQTVEQPVPQYEELEGLPFYYSFDLSFSYLLIFLGIVLLVGHIVTIVFGCVMPFYLKKYICTKCKKTYVSWRKPQRCSICGSEVVPIEDYDPDKK